MYHVKPRGDIFYKNRTDTKQSMFKKISQIKIPPNHAQTSRIEHLDLSRIAQSVRISSIASHLVFFPKIKKLLSQRKQP